MGRRNWSNWDMTQSKEGTERLKELFERSIIQCGEVRIYTVLNSVSSSGMTRHISAFVPIIVYEEYRNEKTGLVEKAPSRADMVCIARERTVSGCGMDMGFHLAYSLYMQSGIDDDKKHPYQKYLNHSWL